MKEEDWQNWFKILNERITNWLSEETKEEHFCRICGKRLMSRTIYCSVHDDYQRSGVHSGGGKVHTFEIPECPDENCPNHRPSFWNRHLQLDGDTLRGPCIDS